MKKSVLLYVIVTVVVILNIIYYSLGNISLYYVDSELTLNSANDKIKEEIYEYVKTFDKNIIESLQVYDNEDFRLNDEQIIDIAVKYIISNQNEFKEKIEHFEDEYNYEKDGTIYYSKGYVDKATLKSVIYSFFGNRSIDIENSIYFDSNKKLIALLSIYGDISPYKREVLIDFNELDYYTYEIMIKYYISDSKSFNITYQIERNKFSEYGKYKLLGMKLN